MKTLLSVQIIVIELAYYMVYGFATFLVAKRLGRTDAWMGFVPILNLFLICQMARKEPSYFLWVVVGSFFCGIIGIVLIAAAWADIAGMVGKPRWYGWLTLIPLAGLAPLFIMGSGGPIVNRNNPVLLGLPDQYRQGPAYQQAYQGGLPPRPDLGYPPQGAYAPPPMGFVPPPVQPGPIQNPKDPFGDESDSSRKKPYIPPKGWV
jgi:hypothetical protein